ncbi:L,D-transpeptidase [uncultured Rhodoblastus sp.]|uniref:L,D-transpeptidase n=1 Tax=uncultured Rhodoblastus sp. TaxID=543037 RepID=UPI0025D89450|nr:L,D-transpeptidase [uncultured Rhodoblastus sp.]
MSSCFSAPSPASLRKFRPALLAGLLLIGAAPQASAQFWPWEQPAPQKDKNVKPRPQTATRTSPQGQSMVQPQAETQALMAPQKPLRAKPVHQDDDDDFNLTTRTSLHPSDGGVVRRGGGANYASIPADADPNYSTPVDLDGAVNYKQATQRLVPDPTGEPSGTLTINTKLRKLYLSLGGGQAVEYGIAVGKSGFAWKGVASVGRKSYWPGWTPPPEMIERRPELPEHMDGSLSNPLGARALYLFQGNTDTLFRIHGTNEPSSIGHAASSGCIRMHNADVIDLYGRVSKGARVVVM